MYSLYYIVFTVHCKLTLDTVKWQVVQYTPNNLVLRERVFRFAPPKYWRHYPLRRFTEGFYQFACIFAGKGCSFIWAPRIWRDRLIYIITKIQAINDSSTDINARTNAFSGRKCHCCVLRNFLATNEKLPQNTPQDTIEFKNIYYSRLNVKPSVKNLEKTTQKIYEK